jgi:hypothetical protein
MIARYQILTLLGCAYLAACAAAPQGTNAPASEEKKPVWSVPTEAETAAALDSKFHEAAKGFVKLKKDGVLLFCKRQREIGSNIPTLHCITESQLRTQVENMDQYRDRMRSSGKCTTGVGCQAGM